MMHPMASRQLKITIVGAQGLRDISVGSEVFCVCEIRKKHHNTTGRFQTPAASASTSPVWNHEHLWTQYEEGDRIVFRVFAREPLLTHTPPRPFSPFSDASDDTVVYPAFTTSEDLLGQVELESSHFRSQPFQGELLLSDFREDVQATLTVRVAMLSQAIPVVIIQHVRLPRPLFEDTDLGDCSLRRESSEPVRPSSERHPLQAARAPLTADQASGANRSGLLAFVDVGLGSLRQAGEEEVLRRSPLPRQAGSSGISPPSALAMPSGGARAAGGFGTGKHPPSFPLHAATAWHQRCDVYHYYRPWAQPAPRP
jgi:hypothetical protein